MESIIVFTPFQAMAFAALFSPHFWCFTISFLLIFCTAMHLLPTGVKNQNAPLVAILSIVASVIFTATVV